MTTRTRIAPSPTGEDIHIGNLYTAVINFAVAKKNHGKFIIRIEDTDRERYVAGAEEKILSSLRAFGINYAEGPDIGGPFAPYRQSERLPLYQQYAKELIEKEKAYYCFCTKERLDELRASQQAAKQMPRYDKHCLSLVDEADERIKKGDSFVIRLNVAPGKTVWFDDLIRGEIKFESDQIDDQILIKSDGYPTYHMGVVVDDHLMEISHIIRAEEWISSTPKHIILYESFGWDLPIFCHLPILRNPDKSKLSKRKNPVWASWYIQEGYLSEAVINYLSLLGWSHPEEKEVFTFTEFVEKFELKDIKPVAPIFDIVKLTWMNQQYILKMSNEELLGKLEEFYNKKFDNALVKPLLPLLKTRMTTLKDFTVLTDHFFREPEGIHVLVAEKPVVSALQTGLEGITVWNHEEIFHVFKTIMTEQKVRMPVLYRLLTGYERGLPLPESIEILGKEKTLERLSRLIG